MAEQEINITVPLVKNLIIQQFPKWKDLPIKSVERQGWDNRTYHLGNEMLIRLPSSEGYVRQVHKEQKWLPILAPKLPLPIPQAIALGQPSTEYPLNWSVYKWLDGSSANTVELSDEHLKLIAEQLANFLTSLHKIEAGNVPPGLHNWWRAAHTSVYDEQTRELIDKLKNIINTDKATSLWARALDSQWDKSPVWVHGDVASGNILIKDYKISAIIDFGCCGVGDPACDLTIAWTYFKDESREIFKKSMNLDADTWARARGWALWKAMYEFSKIDDKHSPKALEQKNIIDSVLNEHLEDVKKSLKIRSYKQEDAKDLANIFYNTIHKINIRDYSLQQVDVWASKSSLELTGWKKKWGNLQPIVAVLDNKIVGFTEFDVTNGYIDCFYCHHEYIGVGVGSLLIQEIFNKVRDNKINRVYAHVSITAKPFFEAKGFKIIKNQTVERSGVKLDNYVMEKYF